MPDATAEITDAWIVSRRGARNAVDPRRPYAYLVEDEPSNAGRIESVATIFLTNRECPFRCLMCDLWKNTTDETVAPGMIAGQIRWSLDRLPRASVVKLYNSGNFFDPGAIPEGDYREIADAVSTFDTVIVESHPGMIGRRFAKFRGMIQGRLQVAMGLETIHPEVLPRLNKRMTTDDFKTAVSAIRAVDADVRAFILLRPPYLTESQGVEWAKRSLDFAFDAGVECCAVIPTRGGNGAMEALLAQGEFEPPTLASLEDVLDYGLSLRRGRVFADLWDIEHTATTSDSHGGPEDHGLAAQDRATRLRGRIDRLKRMNLSQNIETRIAMNNNGNQRP